MAGRPDCENCTMQCPQAEMAREIAKGRMYAMQEMIRLQKELQAYKDAEERGELVRVVRCRDCVHWTESQTSVEYGTCEKDAPLRWSDFWCAEAEMREDKP